jgi:hypothetical protein
MNWAWTCFLPASDRRKKISSICPNSKKSRIEDQSSDVFVHFTGAGFDEMQHLSLCFRSDF